MVACEQTRLRAFLLVGCFTKVSLRQARSRGGGNGAMGAIAPPNSESSTKNFQYDQAFDL